jgi:hypothetical protein
MREFHNVPNEALLQLYLLPGRLRFRWKNRKRLSASESLKAALKSCYEKATQAKLPSYQGIYNVGLFLALLEQDISAFSESILFARTAWHRRFHARNLAVLLYEASEDLPALLGRDFRAWITKLTIGSSWLDSLNGISKKLSNFHKTHGRFLKEIRIYIGAHREHDAILQMSVMEKLDALEVYRRGAELSEPLRELVAYYIGLLKYLNNPMIMVRDMTGSQPTK